MPAATPDPTPAALRIPCIIISLNQSCKAVTRLTQPTPARHTAPTAASIAALMTPHSSKISRAATLLMMTAHETALALLGRSYFQISNNSGKSLKEEDVLQDDRLLAKEVGEIVSVAEEEGIASSIRAQVKATATCTYVSVPMFGRESLGRPEKVDNKIMLDIFVCKTLASRTLSQTNTLSQSTIIGLTVLVEDGMDLNVFDE
ncbi:hypothetical protein KCU93_g222, partial [Aureobasidium melanogenum]